MKKLMYIICSLFFSISVLAIEKVEQANTLYSLGEYEKAVSVYKSVINEGIESSVVYYNLGNSYYKLGDVASSILYYERSLLLDPNNEDAKFNLELAQLKIVDKIDVIQPLFLKRWLDSLINWKSSNSWAWTSIVSLLLFVILINIYFFIRRYEWLRKVSFFSALFILLIFCSSTVFSLKQKNKIENRVYAIVFADTVTVKGAPDDTAVDLFVIHEGTKVKIENTLENWNEIKLPDGKKGWLESVSIVRI